MKRNILLFGQAFLLGVILVFGGITVVNEKFSSIKSKDVKEKMNNYYEEKFKDLDVLKGKFKYNKDTNSYSITYYNKEYEKLNFTITSKNNKISDNYIENYVKGKDVIEEVTSLVSSRYKEVFKDTNYEKIKVSFKNLNQYNDAEKIDILDGNVFNNAYYSVSYYVKVDSLDKSYLNNLINSFITISKNNGLVANSYSITFDNNGIIKLVKVLEGGKIIYE